MKITLLHPGHAMTTAWVYDGYKKFLDAAGHSVLEVRLDKLIAFGSAMVESMPNKFEGDQGATSEQWKSHIAQQLSLIRIMECELEHPDVLLTICGKMISPQNYLLFNLIPGRKVVLLTESPYEDAAQRFYAQFYDFAFVNDQSSVEAIGEIVPAVYMPHGYDPEIYSKTAGSAGAGLFFNGDTRDPVGRKIFDVSFIGTPFGNRKAILQALRYAPDLNPWIFDATTYEPEDGSGKQVVFVPPASAAECYHSTKVNLNIHRTEKFYGNGEHIASAHSLGPRTFEIAGCAEFQLCDDARPELLELFGDTIATYHQPEEVVDAVRYWADGARDSLRADMALASWEIAQKHTYQDRAARLVKQLAQWYNRPDWLEEETHA